MYIIPVVPPSLGVRIQSTSVKKNTGTKDKKREINKVLNIQEMHFHEKTLFYSDTASTL